jgi:CRISPR-associated protein Csm1
MDDDEMVLVVAGLMHDVGKVVQRAGRRVKHQDLSGELLKEFLPGVVDVDVVWDLVVRHHEAGDHGLLGFLVKADHLSAMEREVELNEDGRADYKSLYRLLQSPLTDGCYYGLRPLDLAQDLSLLKPVREGGCSVDDYRSLLNRLSEDLGRIRRIYSRQGGALAYVVTLAEALRKYLFFCPSAPSVEREPTNSLYEHSRMVAALSVSLKRSGGRGFTIIYGDIGGIQRFVYGQRVYKAALKSLRGRSLYITILSDAIAKHLLLTLDLPHVNLIYSSGGNFMLISGLLDEEGKRSLVRQVNRFMLRRHGGLLRASLGFADVLVEDAASGRVPRAILEAIESARMAKERAFQDMLGQSYSTFFEPKLCGSGEVCESCGLEAEGGVEAEGMRLCRSCHGLVSLAKSAALAKYLVEIWVDEGAAPSTGLGPLDFTADGLRAGYALVESPGELDGLARDGLKLVWIKRLNDADFLLGAEAVIDALRGLPVAFGFTTLPTHTPLVDGDILSFDELARRSEGQRMIGYLKLDLDNVGELVKTHSEKLSSLALLTQLLSLIMEWCVNTVAKSSPNIYLIYSGGDDMLAVGPWSDVAEFADRLSVELEGLIGGGLSFTAAMSVEEPKAPVKVVMDSLAGSLRRAKDRKDCIALGDERLAWENFRTAARFARRWAGDIRDRRISRALVFDVARLYDEYVEEQYWTHVRHRLKYVLSRSIERWPGSSVPIELDRLEKEYLQALSSLFPMMRVVTWMVEGLTREEGSKP